MSRKEKVLETAQEIMESGEKVSASRLSREMGWLDQDIHRCLNALEKEDRVKTRSKDFMGRKIRMVEVYR